MFICLLSLPRISIDDVMMILTATRVQNTTLSMDFKFYAMYIV